MNAETVPCTVSKQIIDKSATRGAQLVKEEMKQKPSLACRCNKNASKQISLPWQNDKEPGRSN